MKTAWGYARCSTDEQDQSIAQQKREIEQYAKDNGYMFTQPYWFEDEGRSGVSADNRPGFQRMIEALDQGLYSLPTVILVYDISRFGRFRRANEAAHWSYVIEEYGVEIIYTHSDIPGGFGSATITSLHREVAAEHSRKLSQIVARGMKHNASRGYWNGGRTPYACFRELLDQHDNPIKVLKKGESKGQKEYKVRLIPGDPKEIQVVLFIFNCYVYRDMGMRLIAGSLNQEKIPSPDGGLWSPAMVCRILDQKAYIGVYVWGKVKRGEFSKAENNWEDTNPSKTRHDQDKWVVFEGMYQPMVSKELFEKAQAIRRSRRFFQKGQGGRSHGSRYLLSGILFCAQCGYKMVSHTDTKKGQASYQYYRDGGYQNIGKEACSSLNIPRGFLDDFALEKASQRLKQADWLDQVEDRVRGRLSNSMLDQRIESLERELREIDEKIERLLFMIEDGHVASIKDRLLQRNQEKEAMLAELEQLKQERVSLSEIDEMLADMRSACEDALTVLRQGTVDEQKQVIRSLVKQVVVDRDSKSVDFHFFKIPQSQQGSFFRASSKGREAIGDVEFHLDDIRINAQDRAAQDSS